MRVKPAARGGIGWAAGGAFAGRIGFAAAMAAALCALPPEPAFANSLAGTRGGPLLTAGASARARGMGNAGSALPDDNNALFVNPAGLGTLKNVEFTAARRNMFAGLSQNQLGLVVPLETWTSSNVPDFGAMGFSLSTMNYGDLDGRSASGAPRPSFSARDELWGLTYGLPVAPAISAGARMKYYRFRLAEKVADGALLDAGVLFSPGLGRWSAGLAAQNMGSGIGYDQSEDPAPGRLVAGVSTEPLEDRLVLAADAVDPQDGPLSVRAGLEITLGKIMRLRAGYDSSDDLGGLTAGMGFRVEEMAMGWFPVRRLSLDYSFVPSSDLEDIHFLSLTLRFGDQ
ncbi:MAG: PorV/PorQ family protein [Elusimicrobiota bacterium]